jgi:hypothetical protein
MVMKCMEKLSEQIKFLEILYDFIIPKIIIVFLLEMRLDMESRLDLLLHNLPKKYLKLLIQNLWKKLFLK